MTLEPCLPLGLFRQGFRQFRNRGPAPYAPLGLADRLGAGEDSRHRVVVALRDGIEFVVVAPRTGNGQAQERLADLVDLLIDDVDTQLGLVGLDDRQVAQHEEAGGDQFRARSSAVPKGSKSPASCSRMKRSNGMSALNAAMT